MQQLVRRQQEPVGDQMCLEQRRVLSVRTVRCVRRTPIGRLHSALSDAFVPAWRVVAKAAAANTNAILCTAATTTTAATPTAPSSPSAAGTPAMPIYPGLSTSRVCVHAYSSIDVVMDNDRKL